MKQIILSIVFLFGICQTGYAQFPKNISTHPDFPVNDEFLPMHNAWIGANHTVNPFLNTGFDWRLFNSIDPNTAQMIIPLDLRASWIPQIKGLNSGNNYYPMDNPFNLTNYLGTLSGIPSGKRDYHWEDGWELLWLNMGYYPNGSLMTSSVPGSFITNSNSPKPNHIPYFVLYNRYRGTVRLFSNVWFDPTDPIRYENIVVKFGYNKDGAFDDKISGLLRNTGGYDLALDQPTQSHESWSPRQHPVNQSEWQVADFQVAFDPCVCMKAHEEPFQSGQLEFEFQDFTELNFDMMSRTVETTQEVTKDNYDVLDFLNLSMVDENNYQPGYRMYRRMNNLYSDYENRLDKYETDLNDYNQPWNTLKRQALNLGKDFISTGISGGFPVNFSANFIRTLTLGGDTTGGSKKVFSNAMKGLIGLGFDFATFEVSPEKPRKPSIPSANFSETFYKGSITPSVNPAYVSGLYIPGAFTQTPSWSNNTYYGYGSESSLDPRLFPAYNKVLGQVALLESPSVEFNSELVVHKQIPRNVEYYHDNCFVIVESDIEINFDLRITEQLKVALNNSLDFDYEKTKTYATLIVELEIINTNFNPTTWIPTELSHYPLVLPSELKANLFSHHALQNENGFIDVVLASGWIDFEDLNQYVFSYHERLDFHYLTQREEFPIPGGGVSCGIIKKAIEGGLINHYEAYELYDYAKIKSIKLKLLHDMYFDQIGSFDEQVNSTQVYTYLLYENKEGDEYYGPNVQQLSSSASLNKYTAGTLTIGDEHINPNHPYVFETSGNTIYINAEEVNINGELTVEDGYELFIQSLYPINVLEDAKIGKNITLRIKKDWFDLDPFTYMDNSEVYNFCNDNTKYQANQLAPIPRKRLEAEIAERELQEMLKKERTPEIQLHPNPTSSTVVVSGLDENSNILHIYDLKGMKVYSQDVRSLQSTSLDVSGLMSGIYLIVVERENGLVSQKRLNKL